MALIDSLQPLQRDLVALLRAAAGSDRSVDLAAEARRLWDLALEWEADAPAGLEGTAVRLVLCTVNTLIDAASREALGALADHLETADRINLWDGARDHVLRGGSIELAPETASHGSSMMRWDAFEAYYADSYGRPAGSGREVLWRRIVDGELAVPREDLHFDGHRGVVWFTDRDELYEAAKAEDGTIDGTSAYDALGLDWRVSSTGAEAGTGDANRAVVLHCSLSERSRADRGLRRPTAVDAWGHWLFSPSDPNGSCRWAELGSRAAVPATGETVLPEGVHGPLDLEAGSRVPVEACSPVAKTVGDRVTECAREVARRALERLC